MQGLELFEAPEVLTMTGAVRRLEPTLTATVPALSDFGIPEHRITISASAYERAVADLGQSERPAWESYAAKPRSSALCGLKRQSGRSYVVRRYRITPALLRAAYGLLRHADRPEPEHLVRLAAGATTPNEPELRLVA
jgi:hypothetical protein